MRLSFSMTQEPLKHHFSLEQKQQILLQTQALVQAGHNPANLIVTPEANVILDYDKIEGDAFTKVIQRRQKPTN
jgi:hypothetical protein